MKKRIHVPFIVLCIVAIILPAFSAFAAEESPVFIHNIAWFGPLHPVLLPEQGESIVLTGENDRGLFLFNPLRDTLEVISFERGAGRYIDYIESDNLLAFKEVLQSSSGTFLQRPFLYSFDRGEKWPLHESAVLVGQPRFLKDGTVGFSVGPVWVNCDQEGRILSETELDQYYNFVTASPNGRQLLYADDGDRIVLLDRISQSRKIVTAEGFKLPIWSPDGQFLAYSSLSGKCFIESLSSGTIQSLGQGDCLQWLGETNNIVFRAYDLQKEVLLSSQVKIVSFDGKVLFSTDLQEKLFYPVVSSHGSQLIYANENSMVTKLDFDGNDFRALTGKLHFDCKGLENELLTFGPIIELDHMNDRGISEDSIVHLSDVPYHHQVYDTPSWFNGYGACGATSATMTIAYYGKFNDWTITATGPYEHPSHFGRYVSDSYTYNGHTFNLYSSGGYGGHGYIWQNGGEDTKGHMAEYISYHGLSSPSVDWSPTWTELQNEINAGYPSVLLVMLTSSGHYVVSVGYHRWQHTVYCNDPYGNKNQGYMNYNGAGVSYDWPGYNNGYASLSTLHCYIYSRGTPDVFPGTPSNPIQIPSFPFSHSDSTASSGGSDMFDYYSCSPSTNESGREKIYRFSTSQGGVLKASVSCPNEVDIDLHLLTGLNSNSCLTRAHISFSYTVSPGTYYISCDTYVNGSGVELMGDYTVNLTLDATSTARTY